MKHEDPIGHMAAALVKHKGYAYAAGVLATQLNAAVALLPKTKQKMFLLQMEKILGDNIEVEVTSLMNGEPVKIRWDQLGTCTDPSMESYWQM